MAIKMEYDPNDSTWKPTVNIIRDTTDADEWTPHPDWPDIKYILQNDTYGYAGSFIELITDDYDTISLSGGVAYRTSDGAYYTSATVTHTWDKTKDVSCARGYKTRWVITYLSSDTLSTYLIKQKNDLWLVFNCNLSNKPGLFQCPFLESVEFINDKNIAGTINCNYFLQYCPSLKKFIDLSAIIATGIDGGFYLSSSLENIILMDISNSSIMTNMFNSCNCLVSISGIVNMQNAVQTTSMFSSCWSLKNVQIKNLKVSLSLSYSIFLTHASLLYLLQNLQTVTAGSQTLTLGATNLAKLTDTEKALATDKGWLLA